MSLADQDNVIREIRFPHPRPLYIVAAGRSGAGQIAEWVKPVNERFGAKVEIVGLADVEGVPTIFRGAVRMSIREGTKWPVLMDWKGEVVRKLCSPAFGIEVFVVQPGGAVTMCLAGASTTEAIEKVSAELERILSAIKRKEGKGISRG